MAAVDAGRLDQLIAPPAAQAAAAVAARVLGTPARFLEARDPYEALLDLQLPEELAAPLARAVAAHGFVVEPKSVQDPYSMKRRTLMVLTDGACQIHVAHIPHWIVTENTQANLGAFGLLQPAFANAQPLIIVSKDCEAMHLPFDNMLQAWKRPPTTLKARFVPWNHVRDFAEKSEDEQGLVLNSVFRLDLNGAQPPRITTLDDLPEAERKTLVSELSSKAATAPSGAKAYLTNFVRELALPADWAAEVADPWTGDANADARKLVQWAFEKGKYPPTSDRRDWLVAGALAWRLAEDDYGPSGQELTRIIVARRLVFDPEMLVTLRKRLQPD